MNKLIMIFCGIFSLLISCCCYSEYWNGTSASMGRDSRRIRNKFVTFDTTDTNVEVAFQFNVPFVAVPTDRGINNVKNSIKSFANLNLGSVALAGIMIVIGSFASFLWRTLLPKPNRLSEPNETSNNNTEESLKSKRAREDNKFINLMYLLEKTIQTNINPSMCMQQFICTISRSSAQNVARGCGTSAEKILDGIFSSKWIGDMIASSAVHDAISYGELLSDCKRKFDKCGLSSSNLENIFDLLMRSLGLIKW